MKILAINIGNSRVAAGWFERDKIRRSARLAGPSPVLLEAVAEGETPEGICVASVAPKRNAAWRQLIRRAFPRVRTLWVESGLDFGMGVDLTAPERTGADRYADAVAGAELFGAPCIVCDFGTATSFNLVLPRRGFAGGAIAPGYGMWFSALHAGAAKLPLLKPGGVKAATGRCPEEAMRLGARWGFRGMTVEILWQLSKACGKKEPVLAATGGYAAQVMKDCGLTLPVVPDLTLHGIARIYEHNAG